MRIVSVIFCDKILKLESGLSQMIGVHRGRIVGMGAGPNPIAPLDVAIMIEHDRAETLDIEIRVKAPDGGILFFQPMTIAFSEPLGWGEVCIAGLGVPLTHPGRLAIEVHRVGEVWEEVGAIHVDLKPQVVVEPARLSA